MSDLPAGFNPSRRPSLAESIEVTIEHSTCSTYVPPTGAVAPAAIRAHSPARRTIDPDAEVIDGLWSYSFPSSTKAATPPPYAFPSISAAPPLVFYPTGTSESSTTVSAAGARPPTYRPLLRTPSERWFWWGCACAPLWALGAARIWWSSIPREWQSSLEAVEDGREKDDVARVELALGGAEGWQRRAPSIAESVEVFRAEELLWAKRCLCCLGGALSLGAGVAAMVIGVIGN